MGIHGPADGLRVSHKAMPGRGTEGLVVFPAGDNRNGIWICSLYVQQMDSLTSDTDQFLEYESHWSGHLHLLDGQGNFTEAFADGSFLQIGAGTTPPATYRHTVDSQQKRQAVQVTQSERVTIPPPPFNVTLRHASGTTAAIDPSGNTRRLGCGPYAQLRRHGSEDRQQQRAHHRRGRRDGRRNGRQGRHEHLGAQAPARHRHPHGPRYNRANGGDVGHANRHKPGNDDIPGRQPAPWR